MNEELRKDAASIAQIKLDDAPIAIFEVDRDACIRYVNRQASLILGYTREELCALRLFDFDLNVTPDLWQKNSRAPDALRDRTFESLFRRKDGTVFPVEVTVRFREIDGKSFSFAFAQDITERRRGKAELRENEERLRLALEGSSDGIWDWNLETGAVYFSPRYYTMLGYQPGEFPASYESWLRLLHPEDLPQAERAVQDAIRSRDPFAIEFRLRRKNGEWLWILGRGKVAEVNPVGQAVRIAGYHTDISQLKRTEQALQESQFFLQRSQAVARIGSYWLDIPRGLWIASPALDAIFGISGTCRTDVEFWNNLIHPADREAMSRYFREHVLAGNNRFDREYRIVRRNDGEIRWVHGLGELEFDAQGAAIKMIGTIQDITERKRGEEALRESEALYRLLFDSNPQPMWVLDCENLAFLNVNEAFCKQYGYSREELSQLTLKDIRLQSDIPLLLDRAAPGNEGVHEVCTRHRKKDGTVLDIQIVSYPLMYAGRRARLVLASDITQRLRSEAALRELEQQLFQAQKMEAIGRLAGGVAHDFNNHLTVIIGYCQMILSQLDAQDPVATRILQVLRAGDQSARLTQQLLAFSRKQVMQPRRFCPNEVILDTTHMLERLIGENIQLASRLDPELGAIEADPGQLNQVLMNLAVNARDALPNGGKISIETSNVVLDTDFVAGHRALQPGPYVLIAVSDNGAGMDKATLDRAFEPFFTTKTSGAGTGLGLAMVYGIVQQSGGSIQAESEPGRGTKFSIYFPRVKEQAEAAPQPDSLLKKSGGGQTILVVEDTEDVRTLTVSILESLGYQVLCASHGAEALENFGHYAGPIHLMITDVVMPGITGPDLAKRMAQLRPDMKVLFTSGYTANVLAPHGVLEAGVAYLPKPFTPTRLAEKVHGLLSTEEPA
jgi:PAS domain S-box-containing protein